MIFKGDLPCRFNLETLEAILNHSSTTLAYLEIADGKEIFESTSIVGKNSLTDLLYATGIKFLSNGRAIYYSEGNPYYQIQNENKSFPENLILVDEINNENYSTHKFQIGHYWLPELYMDF